MNLEAAGMLALFYFMIYGSVFWLLLYYEQRKTVDKDPKTRKCPALSIVIPVYQGDTKEAIKKAVISCLSLEYPKKEIILSWNGPVKKDVVEVCRYYEKKGLVKYLYTPKQGKAAGVNNALKRIKTEYFCCLDGDSFFQPNALQQMVGYLSDPNVAAVTSSMKVYRPKNWVQMVQWVEYVFAIYLRRLMSLLNALYVVPGPGGLYRTSVIREIGGFDETSLVEDMEVCFRIQKAGYKIKDSIKAYVDTIAPDTLKGLINQRVRWYAGFYDTIKKHRDMVFNPKYGYLGLYIIPTSVIWIAILFISLGLIIRQNIMWYEPVIRSLMLVGFDWEVFVKSLMSSIYIEPTYITWFGLVFFAISLGVIYLGLKLATEKVDLRRKFPNYCIYLFAYTILLSVFWVFAVAYLVVRKRKENEWIKW